MKKIDRENTSFRTAERIINKEGDFGLRTFGEKKQFRSQYEYAFSVYLNELKIKYEFEITAKKIKTSEGVNLHYIPDFYLPDYRIHIEIINQINKRLKYKMFYFKEQYPDEKFVVFDKKSLRDMFNSKFTIYDVIGKPKKGGTK